MFRFRKEISIVALIAAFAGMLFMLSRPEKFDLAQFEKERILRLADDALKKEPVTIVSVRNPESAGGIHDYSSEGDYWWPDPKNPDGPYVQRDGQINPKNFVEHRKLLISFSRTESALLAAYKITGDETYAAAAARHLRAWFVDSKTMMNPRLDYAQAVKGKFQGRGIGIVDTVHLAEVAEGIEALSGSPSYSAKDALAVSAWFKTYETWLRQSIFGLSLKTAKNNLQTSWALQVATFAKVAGDEAVIDEIRKLFKEKILPGQMARDGSFPAELARTRPYNYSIFNLDIMTALARVLSTPSEDMITWKTPDGKSVEKGIHFMAPYLKDKSLWPKPADVSHWDSLPARSPFLVFGAVFSKNKAWLDIWKKLDSDPEDFEIGRNMPIREPVLWLSNPHLLTI